MSVFSSIPFSDKTVYRTEYTEKSAKIVSSPYKRLDDASLKKDPFSKDDPLLNEKVEEFRKQIENCSPSTKKFLSTPLDIEIVKECLKNEVKSTYDADFCKLKERDKPSCEKLSLPDDWFFPSTTQQASYRSPTIWGGDIVLADPILPSNNLMPNEKERAILGIKTGHSDYTAQIGKTGLWIIENKIHGDVNVRPKFDEEDLKKFESIKEGK